MPLSSPVVRIWFATCLITVRERMSPIGPVEHRSMSPRASLPNQLPQILALQIFPHPWLLAKTSLPQVPIPPAAVGAEQPRDRHPRKYWQC